MKRVIFWSVMLISSASFAIQAAKHSQDPPAGQSKEIGIKMAINGQYRVLNEAIKAKDIKQFMRMFTWTVIWIDADKKKLERKELEKKFEEQFGRTQVVSMCSNTVKDFKIEGNKATCVSTQIYKALENAGNGKKRRIATSTVSKDSWILGPGGWILEKVEVMPSKSKTTQANRPPPASKDTAKTNKKTSVID